MGVGNKRIFYRHWFRGCIDIKYDDWLPGGAVDCNGYLHDKYVFYWQTKPAEQKNYQSGINVKLSIHDIHSLIINELLLNPTDIFITIFYSTF